MYADATLNAVCLTTAMMALLTLAGFTQPARTFGRWIAPYTLAGTITLMMVLVVSLFGALMRGYLGL